MNVEAQHRWELARGRARASWMLGRALWRTVRDERRDGTLGASLRRSLASRGLSFAGEPSVAELLERRARQEPNTTLLTFEGEQISGAALNARANAIAAGLQSLGARSGEHVAILSDNCPQFLEVFFATQKLGMGLVPVNSALLGDGLAYVLDNARARYLFVHHSKLAQLQEVRDRLPQLAHTIAITEGQSSNSHEQTAEGWREQYRGAPNPGAQPDPEAVSLLLYTSGTTGAPKGVVHRYRDANLKRLRTLGHLLYEPSDALYTCLPLFHANALLLTVVQALNVGLSVTLGRRFSASQFWLQLARSGATSFNALGAMIPILLKQPPSRFDREHRVRLVVSAACPASA